MGSTATYRRTRRWLACVPLLCGALLALPGAALARAPRTGNTGGVGMTGGGDVTTGAPTTTTPAVQVVRLRGVVNASGDGITLTAAASGTQNRPLTIRGDAPGQDAGDTIYIETTRPGSLAWTEVATTIIGAKGAFRVRWIPTTSAQVQLRAVLGLAPSSADGSSGGSGLPGPGSAAAAASPIATAPLTIPIFRSAVATIYGPGFWGHHTACGERLTRTTLGVASRTLPCGTRVAVFYRGREITVPVIDRGPFANGASWDLTMATAKVLNVRETVTIGTLSPAPPDAAR